MKRGKNIASGDTDAAEQFVLFKKVVEFPEIYFPYKTHLENENISKLVLQREANFSFLMSNNYPKKRK